MKAAYIFPLSLGFTDGIITSLMIAARLIFLHQPLALSLAFRIAIGSASVGAFSYFIATFASNRASLTRLSRQLNPSSPWKLFKGNLPNEVLIESIIGTTISGLSGFLGSLIPLGTFSITNSNVLVSLIATEAAMGVLGYSLSLSFDGRRIPWTSGMILFGIAVMLIGSYVKIIS